MIAEARNLRQMRYANHLAASRQYLQPLAHRRCRRAAHTRVHFIEHQRGYHAACRESPIAVFSANAMRDNSPPEAIFSKGFNSSPRFGDTRKPISSMPFALQLDCFTLMLNCVPLIIKLFSSLSTCLLSVAAAR